MKAYSRAYIGLGSNLDEPVAQLASARRQLAFLQHTHLVCASRDYSSLPWGDPDQPDFVNAVVALDTALSPDALLAELLAIEVRQGRGRNAVRRNGPRTLDLDLLLYGTQILKLAHLQIPHPGICERAFVLLPLAEIAPELVIPGVGPIESLLKPDFASLCWPRASPAAAP